VHAARDAIEARTDLTPAQQTDHLAVLWFIAEAEDVPTRVMKEYITEERLMASTLYQSIFEKGEARGEARGDAARCAKMTI
jgi:predicted transposase YdaD